MLPPPPRSTLFPYTTLFRSIRARQLQALEEERFDWLPGDAYARSFLRTYADYLGLEWQRSEEHTSELQSLRHLVCRLLLEKKKNAAVQPIALMLAAIAVVSV